MLGGRAAAARNLRYNANRARPSTGKHTPRLGHTVPRARERGWLLAREGSFRDPLQDHARIIPRPGGRRDCNQSSRAACRSIRAPWASGWRAGDAALSAQRRVPDGVRPRVTREVRSGCVAVSLAECLVLWFCVSLLCDRHRPSCVHPYRVGVPVVGRTVFRLPINQSINQCCALCTAPPAARRSGGRRSRGALRPPRRAPVTTGGRLNSPSGAGWTPARSAIPALAAGSHPWASYCGNHLKAGACAGDGLTQQLKGSHSPHHRARAAAGVPHTALRHHAALRQDAAAAPLLLDSHRVLDGPLRGRGQHRAGSLLRAGADRGCDSRLRRRICGLAHARLRVQTPRRSRAPPPPARVGISVRESCVLSL